MLRRRVVVSGLERLLKGIAGWRLEGGSKSDVVMAMAWYAVVSRGVGGSSAGLYLHSLISDSRFEVSASKSNFIMLKIAPFNAFRETKIPLSLAFFQRQQWFVEY